MATTSCPSCGAPPQATSKLSDLESQVQLLRSQLQATAEKLATAESAILAAQTSPLRPPTAPLSPTPSETLTITSIPPPPPPVSQSRISSFLSTTLRRAQTTPTVAPTLPVAPPSPPPSDRDSTSSAAEVLKERNLRLVAEEKLRQVSDELEELSVSLFQSANEMVAEERRLRSKLEEKVEVLERKEREKGERLGVLERAVERVGRVRELLGGGGGEVAGREVEKLPPPITKDQL